MIPVIQWGFDENRSVKIFLQIQNWIVKERVLK